MATAEEDFTFPTAAAATDSQPRFFDSPPLWRRSSSAKGKEVGNGETIPLPSFQEMRGGSAKVIRKCTSSSTSHDEDELQEKMDMLWENLNDDHQLARNCGQNSDTNSSPRRDVQISCVKGLRLSKARGHIISGKKTSILVFIKVLKKVFLMHNSQRAMKKPSW